MGPFDFNLKRTFLKVPHPPQLSATYAPVCASGQCGTKVWYYDRCLACAAWLCPEHSTDHPCNRLKTWPHQRAYMKLEWDLSRVQIMARMSACGAKEAPERLRLGRTVTLTVLEKGDTKHPLSNFIGAFHAHGFIDFDDGIRWLVRASSERFGTPIKSQRQLFLSKEYATMKMIKEDFPAVPTPKAWPTPTPDPDVDYIFVEFAAGKTLYSSKLREDQYPALVKEVVDYFVAIESHPFTRVGGFYPGGDPFSESPTVVGPLVFGPSDLTIACYPYGPFNTVGEAYLTLLNDMLVAIESGVIFNDSKTTLPAYLGFLEARSLVMACPEMHAIVPTYLRHGDLHLSNILWNEETSQVSAFLDWEFAYATSFQHAFTAPDALLQLPSYDLFSNTNELSPLEIMLAEALELRYRNDMADAVRGSYKYRRLNWLLQIDVKFKWELHTGYWLLRQAFLGELAGPEYQSVEEFMADALSRHGKDEGYLRMKKRVEKLAVEEV